MDADEREIYHYLKAFRREFITEREISRRAGGRKRFQADEEWAKPVLYRMVERRILEVDTTGQYRIRPMDSDALGKKKWISPQIQKILDQSGKDFSDQVLTEEELFRYYDGL